MRGTVLSVFGVVCMSFFALCLFLSDNFLVFWLFLELGSLSLVPLFFLYSDSGVLLSLFNYVLVSGLSSALIVSGLLFEDFIVLMFLGFLVKFGVFPFLGWVYTVVTGSNWLVVWGLATVLKASFLFFSYFFSIGWDGSVNFVVWCCVLTFVFVGVLFWVYTLSWFYYWCHVMVTSSAVLLLMAMRISVDSLLCLYVIYFLWSTIIIVFLSRLDALESLCGLDYYVLVFLLVSFPGSLAIFYKLYIGFCVYSCGFLVFLAWVFYNVSEQFYLLKLLVSEGVSSRDWRGFV